MHAQSINDQTLNDQTLIEKIHTLPPEKVSEVLDFVEFLTQKQEALRLEETQDAEDGAEVRRRQANSNPTERRTLNDLRQAWNQ